MDLKTKLLIADTAIYLEKSFVNKKFKVNKDQITNFFFNDSFNYGIFNDICFSIAGEESSCLFSSKSKNSIVLNLIHMLSHLDASLLENEEQEEVQTVGHLVKFHFVTDYILSYRKINNYCRDLFWFSLDRIVSNHIKFYKDRTDNSRLVELFFCLCVIKDLVPKKDKSKLINLIKSIKTEIKTKNQCKIQLSGLVTVIFRTLSKKSFNDEDYPLKSKRKIIRFLKKQSRIWKKMCFEIENGCEDRDLLPFVIIQLNSYFKSY